ncbi:hypothetical protein [Paracoccus beibuensis]|uniref:hypothetical protein n=1 Tax=Paracoccus beibuensis TaxID=547602 RepID=UPI00223F8443|nr:hypothetical protein [Paracoccus beibuensis]
MDGTLNQLMRLLANRGTEWLRQRIMELPTVCLVDHPDVGLLAKAGRTAPVLTGLRGRISPLEVIVQRRLSPQLVRAGAARVVAGDRSEAMVDLVLAGSLVAQIDPMWQLACEELAEDEDLPLACRLALSDAPDLLHQAEALLTAPPTPRNCDSAHVIAVTDLVMQLYHHGARRPPLSGARAFSAIFDHLSALAERSRKGNCVQSQARLALCLRLLDPGHDVSDMLSDMIQVQRPDGSFPQGFGFSTADQPFAKAALPTLTAISALHIAVYRRWRGARPVWLSPRPMRLALREGAEAVSRVATGAVSAEAAVLLTCATGENWLRRLAPPRPLSVDLPRLAQLCFGDAIAARHLRQWLALPQSSLPRATTTAQLDDRWLCGRSVILMPAPEALLTLWNRAALAGDDTSFLNLARQASYLHHITPTRPIMAMTRRLAAESLLGCHADSLSEALSHLERLLMLARLSPQSEQAAAAA